MKKRIINKDSIACSEITRIESINKALEMYIENNSAAKKAIVSAS